MSNRNRYKVVAHTKDGNEVIKASLLASNSREALMTVKSDPDIKLAMNRLKDLTWTVELATGEEEVVEK